jgi:hypothetical protein
MNDISSALSGFVPITLEEMDHVKLLNRIDTKFILHEAQLPEFLSALTTQYSILFIDGISVHPYETLYFDTPDFRLYRMHHNGKRNRYKLRCRRYTNSGISFFEVKSKTNTGRTIKKRMPVEIFPEVLNENLNAYIQENTPGIYPDYVPVLRVFFDRLTLVNKLANERLTFDMNIRYSNNGTVKTIHHIVIAEVKQEKHSISPFRDLMKLNHQHKQYLSKYCIGISSLNKDLKMNLFKQKINKLTKLGYDIY